MQTEFINIYDNKTVAKVYKYLREIKEDVENVYTLFVVDRQNHLKGTLTLDSLVTSELDENVMEIINPNVITVNYKMEKFDCIFKYIMVRLQHTKEESMKRLMLIAPGLLLAAALIALPASEAAPKTLSYSATDASGRTITLDGKPE